MEIYGIGTDIIEISRIEKAINQTALFKKKVYTEKELSILRKRKIHMPVMQADLRQKKLFPRHLEQEFMVFR